MMHFTGGEIILATTAGATERCDVWEGLLALPPPVLKKTGV